MYGLANWLFEINTKISFNHFSYCTRFQLDNAIVIVTWLCIVYITVKASTFCCLIVRQFGSGVARVRAGFKGGPGGRAPGPTNRGPPPNPLYFISRSIDTHIVAYVVDVTNYFSIF